MHKPGIVVLLVVIFVFTAFQQGAAKSKNHYRTFEITAISENSLTLEDSDGNVIVVEEDPAGFKVGYKVRYDSVRHRLRHYRWQDYEVAAISGDTITLQHETGDILTLPGRYLDVYDTGDLVRYDSVDNKLHLAADSGHWQQFTIVAASPVSITLESNAGRQIILNINNNAIQEPRGVYVGRYKVGDLVRYNAAANKLRKGVIRTYDWQEYVVQDITAEHIVLLDKHKKELILENIYGSGFKPGDSVKYDRLNDLFKKMR